MSFGFNPNTKYESPNSLIPTGALAWATLNVRKLKNGQETGGEYADVELTLHGQYESRKIWPIIMNPIDQRNSEKARQMGMGVLQHACEACGVFDVSNPASYERFNNATFTDILKSIDGKRVAIKVGIKKGDNGHQDKNSVSEWLSPNPNSSTAKYWATLQSGGNVSASQATQQAGFNLSNAASVPTQHQTMQPAGVVTGNTPDWLNGSKDVPF
jgi:hypothetical protein